MPRPRFAALEPDRRQAILAAAAHEIAERGLDGASYNRIIARSGVSKGAMYYYFDGKEDLCLTAVRDAVEQFTAEIGAFPGFEDAVGFWEALEELYLRAIRFVLERPDLAALLRALFARPSNAVDDAIAAYLAEALDLVRDLLERGRAVGAVRDDVPADLLSRVILAMGEASDRWLLERWEDLPDLPEDFFERYVREALLQQMRVAAPLELVIEQERNPS